MKTSILVGISIGTISILGIFAFSSLYEDKEIQENTLPKSPDDEFRELKWNWYGPTSFVLGQPISFSVSRMNEFCDETFDVKIVNLDQSKTFWQESRTVECSTVKGGKISRADFPVETPIEIDTPGTYFVIADFANFYGYNRIAAVKR